MRLDWHIEKPDIERVQSFIEKQKANPFVRARTARNLADEKPEVSKAEFWAQMVGMRLTSVQRSGPESHVARFLRTDPFPLDYDLVRNYDDVAAFISKTLRANGGIRFPDRIAEDLSANYRYLESAGHWEEALTTINQLTMQQDKEFEREAARYVQGLLKGFGPKQARNFLQALGLTRYEIPIDSRITRWLNEFGFPMQLNASVLADAGYYEFALDGFQALCSSSDVFPCVLDAAIFSSFDGDGWTEENTVY